MNTAEGFSDKADSYAQSRWDYTEEAVQAVFTACGLSPNSVVADIGSGTGMLSRHFVPRVRLLLAVEPNPEMRAVAAVAFHGNGSFQSVNGYSDATTVVSDSVDLITVGRALHWFPAESTKSEFRRILKAEGWLAVFSVPCTDPVLLQSLKAVRVEENGWDISRDKERINSVPLSFYFGHDNFRKLVFPGRVRETRDAFLRRICSLSPAPGRNHPLRSRFEQSVHEVFDLHAKGGILIVSNATEVTFGVCRV